MKAKFPFLLFLTAVLFLLNLYFGGVPIDCFTVTDILLRKGSENEYAEFIIESVRLPQALTALLAGAGLGVSGLMLQTVFRNPLAGPSILGISSGANLGVAVVMLASGGVLSLGALSWGGYTAMLFAALTGSLLVMIVLMALASVISNHLVLLIAGIMTGYLTSSAVTLMSSFSSAQGIQGYVLWGMGSFGNTSGRSLIWFTVGTALFLIVSFALAKPLDLLMLGNRYAASLGLNVKRSRNSVLLVTGILTGIITAFCGPVAFIGMAVPHIARFNFRTDSHYILIPASMLWGGIMALVCNVASTIPETTVIPINALTSIVGVPIILWVILRH